MKKFIKNLNNMFNKKNPENQVNGLESSGATPEIEPVAIPEIEIPENLFVEKEPPIEVEQESNQISESRLTQFLNRDFRFSGRLDGYKYHSADILDNYRRLLRSEFREVVDIMIDDLKSKRSLLQKQLIEARLLSPKVAEKYSNVILNFDEHIVRLELEKELSSGDEGLVTKVLHQYRDGFMRGLEEHAEETLLMNNKGLF